MTSYNFNAEAEEGCLDKTQTALLRWYRKNSRYVWMISWIIIIVALAAYVGYCMYYDFNSSIALLVFTVLIVLGCAYKVVKDKAGEQIKQSWKETWQPKLAKMWRIGVWVWFGLLLIGFIVLVALDIKNRPEQLISLAGIAFFIFICFFFSSSPGDVDWGITIRGLACQLVLALIVLRWSAGATALQWLSDKIVGFLNYSRVGAAFVFGDLFVLHPFAMEVAPVLCYFTAVVNLLCYWGVMQVIIQVLGTIFEFLIGTSKVEAFISIAAVFLGPDVPAIMVRSMVPMFTISQMLTLMTSSLSTMDAGMFPVYESMGVPASHLVASSLISAPATLVVSKLLVPEKDKSKTNNKIQLEKIEATNSIDAFARGAVFSIPIIGTMLAMLIAFVSLLEFANTFLTWMGDRVGIVELTLQLIFGYVFSPIAFLIGVPWIDCVAVGRLLGTKTIINEFVAYVDLGDLIKNRLDGLEPQLMERSETIAAYALSGYSNIGTVGWMVGFFAILAPDKRGEISSLAVKSLLSSTIVCFMTAAVAGLLYEG